MIVDAMRVAEPGLEDTRLAVLVGRWLTRGQTRGGANAPAVLIEAVDTYEWLPGRFALLHSVDARVGDEHVVGAELVGWDPVRDEYVTQYFGSDGPNAYEASLGEFGGVLVWTMQSARDRFKGTFSDDGNTITGRWEQLDEDENWQPSMEVTLTRDST
jgi:hypothetical protein